MTVSKNLENPIIHSTTDYTKFKSHAANRPINLNYVTRLAEAIKEKNLLQYNPIIVDIDLHVIEGQHRLKAAEKLGVPIYYIINENSDDSDIIAYNAMRKNWRIENYCDYYISKGNRHYRQAKEYCTLYEIPLNSLINFGRAGRAGDKDYKQFKEGLFVMPADKEFDRLIKMLEHKVKIIQELSEAAIPAEIRRLVRGNPFIRALLSFLKNEDVLPTLCLQKLKVKAESIRACATQHGYASMLKAIYNWKNTNPID